MKKSVLISAFLLAVCLLVVAQTKMFLFFNDGTTYETIATDVDSIVFVGKSVKPEEPAKPEVIEGVAKISAVRNRLSINTNDFSDFAGLYVSSIPSQDDATLKSYQWQYSSDNDSWSEYTFGHGADWDNIRPNKIGYYRCLLTCNNGENEVIYQSNVLRVTGASGNSVNFSSKLPVFLVRTTEDFPYGGSDAEMKAKRSVDVKILWNQDGGSVTNASVNNADMLYYDRKARMNYRGSSSLQNPKKSYAFVTGDKNCDPSKKGSVKTKKQKMFGEDAHKDWVLYASYQDDTYMRNVLSYHQYAEMTGFWGPKCRFVELYVDGSYQGIYVFMDKITQDETRVNINEDTGYILKYDKTDISDRNKTFITSHTGRLNVQGRDHAFEVDYPEDDDPDWERKLSAIKNKVDELENAILENDYEKLATIIDYQSWADWFIINEFTKNVDAYRISCVFTLNSIEDKIVANPIWDYELGWGNRAPFNADTNTKTLMVETQSYYNDAFPTPFWWIGYNKSGCNGILGDCKFKELVKERWAKHTAEGGALNAEVLEVKIDSLAKVLATSSTSTSTNIEASYLKNWATNRTNGLSSIITSWEVCSTTPILPENPETSDEPNANGHEYVDLGLPSGLLWATCNVGAENPEDYGYYFAWGETQPKSADSWNTNSWNNYKWCKGTRETQTKYCTDLAYGTVDNKTILELSDDAAYVNWGGNWRMPTKDEQKELYTECIWKWTNVDGINGYNVTGPNGKHIFLPATSGSFGVYWTSSLSTRYSYDAYYMTLGPSEVYWTDFGRYNVHSVRPVMSVEFNYNVTFDSNGGEGNMQIISINRAEQITIPENKFTHIGYEFICWNTKPDGTGTSYMKGENIIISSNITLYAQWQAISGSSNGYSYVDLGLPSGILWATINVGANSPEQYGYYFAWGETEPKSTYNWETYKWCNGSQKTQTKYCIDSSNGTVDNKTILELSDDAANANWGGEWRIPTKEEQDELRTKCSWEWTTRNGVNGYIVTGPNSNSIFLPASGYRRDSNLNELTSYGVYWSNSLDINNSSYGHDLYFDINRIDATTYSRYFGLTVRPVLSADKD